MQSNAEKSPLAKNKLNLVQRLFIGDVSLPITYWIFYVCIGGGLYFTISILSERYLFDILSFPMGQWFLNGFFWFTVGYFILMLIAIWRSAGKYQRIH